VALPRSVTQRKRYVTHNLDRFGPQCAQYPMSCMLRSSGLIGCVYKMMRMIERGVPASPYIVWEAALQVGLRREYKLCTSRSSLHGSSHAQLPI
jgi:hypothetical protein